MNWLRVGEIWELFLICAFEVTRNCAVQNPGSLTSVIMTSCRRWESPEARGVRCPMSSPTAQQQPEEEVVGSSFPPQVLMVKSKKAKNFLISSLTFLHMSFSSASSLLQTDLQMIQDFCFCVFKLFLPVSIRIFCYTKNHQLK